MTERMDALEGQIAAINTVMSRLVGKLTPLQAAEVAVDLKIERESIYDTSDYATPELVLKTQEVILDSYIELLSVVARKG